MTQVSANHALSYSGQNVKFKEKLSARLVYILSYSRVFQVGHKYSIIRDTGNQISSDDQVVCTQPLEELTYNLSQSEVTES